MTNYNIDFLVKVKVQDRKVSPHYTYEKRKSFINWLTGRGYDLEGVWYRTIGSDFLGKEIPENHVLMGGLIYIQPRVILYYVDGSVKEYFFTTHAGADHFAEKLTVSGKWIK